MQCVNDSLYADPMIDLIGQILSFIGYVVDTLMTPSIGLAIYVVILIKAMLP